MVKFEQCAHHVTDKKKKERKAGTAKPRNGDAASSSSSGSQGGGVQGGAREKEDRYMALMGKAEATKKEKPKPKPPDAPTAPPGSCSGSGCTGGIAARVESSSWQRPKSSNPHAPGTEGLGEGGEKPKNAPRDRPDSSLIASRYMDVMSIYSNYVHIW